MQDHSLKVYTHHLTFLDSFPDLQGWLNLNGFVVRHTHQDFRMQMIYTHWDNHMSEKEHEEASSEATETITVAYCQVCKTVEVSRRYVLFEKQTESEAVRFLEEQFTPIEEEEIPLLPDEGTDLPWLPSEE